MGALTSYSLAHHRRKQEGLLLSGFPSFTIGRLSGFGQIGPIAFCSFLLLATESTEFHCWVSSRYRAICICSVLLTTSASDKAFVSDFVTVACLADGRPYPAISHLLSTHFCSSPLRTTSFKFSMFHCRAFAGLSKVIAFCSFSIVIKQIRLPLSDFRCFTVGSSAHQRAIFPWSSVTICPQRRRVRLFILLLGRKEFFERDSVSLKDSSSLVGCWVWG